MSVSVCVSVCVCVCLSAIISPELHVRSSPNFLCMLPMAVARISKGGESVGKRGRTRLRYYSRRPRVPNYANDCVVCDVVWVGVVSTGGGYDQRAPRAPGAGRQEYSPMRARVATARRMVAIYDYNPRELSPNVDVEVTTRATASRNTMPFVGVFLSVR